MNKFIGKPYLIDPDFVKFDSSFVNFNQKKDVFEYDALKRSIVTHGQTDPIFIKDGLCGNGFHRTKICKEINRKVLAIDVNPNMSSKEYLEMCNKDTFTARNDTATQLAIKAYYMTKDYGYEDAEARKAIGLRDKKAIGYVRFIDNTKFSALIDKLLKGESVEINGSFTKSIEVAKRKISALLEEESITDSEELDDITVDIDYNELINTERGRDLFWTKYDAFKITYGIKMNYATAIDYVKMVNYRFKIQNYILFNIKAIFTGSADNYKDF